MWNMTQLDIEKTLSNVVIKVTHDHSVDKTVIEKRMNALILLGEQFSKYGVSVEVGLSDIRGKFNEQLKNRASGKESGSTEAETK